MRKPELLIPASSLEVLKTAVIFGADAVYIGGETFSLRAKAKNFSHEDMKEGIAFAHAHGVRVHVTANILAHNYDMEPARNYFQELAELSEEEKKEYLDDLGVESSGLDKLVAASYSILGLISFLTAGEDECRAWTIKKGTKAPQAAGKIHTDFERGFIKAEVVNYQDLLDNGSLAAAREKGIVGMEGKEYVVKDGDVILFRFNV